MPCGSGSLFYALSHLLDDDFIPSFLEPTLHTLPPLHPLYTDPNQHPTPTPQFPSFFPASDGSMILPFLSTTSIFTSFLKHAVSPFLKTRLKKTHFIPHTRCIFILHLPLLANLSEKSILVCLILFWVVALLLRAFLVTQRVKNLPAMQETQV